MRNYSSKQDAFGLLTTGHCVIHAAMILDRFKTGNWKTKQKENERKENKKKKGYRDAGN